MKDLPVSDAAISSIPDIKVQRLNAWREEGQRQHDSIVQNVAQIADAITVAGKQKEDEEKGTAADTEELNTLLDLRSRGNVTSMRVNDVRRTILLASTRALQTDAELLRLKRPEDDVSERLANLDQQRRAVALAERSTVNANLETARLKVAAARDRIRALGIRSPKSGFPTRSLYTLYRKLGQREEANLIDEVEPLAPGDVVDVLPGDGDGPPSHWGPWSLAPCGGPGPGAGPRRYGRGDRAGQGDGSYGGGDVRCAASWGSWGGRRWRGG